MNWFTATVAMRPLAMRAGSTAPARSTWAMIQPPKTSPLALSVPELLFPLLPIVTVPVALMVNRPVPVVSVPSGERQAAVLSSPAPERCTVPPVLVRTNEPVP